MLPPKEQLTRETTVFVRVLTIYMDVNATCPLAALSRGQGHLC